MHQSGFSRPRLISGFLWGQSCRFWFWPLMIIKTILMSFFISSFVMIAFLCFPTRITALFVMALKAAGLMLSKNRTVAQRDKDLFKHYPFGHCPSQAYFKQKHTYKDADTQTQKPILSNHGSHFIRFPVFRACISSRKINKPWMHDKDQSGQFETISIQAASLFTGVVIDGEIEG